MKIERRRALRQRRQELPAQIAVDLGDRDQHGEAEAERQHHRRRQRAGPVDVGDRQPQHGDARGRGSRRAIAIRPAAMPRSSANTTTEDADEDRGDALVVGQPDATATSSAITTAISAR